MKVVQVNVTCGYGSTGKICLGISELLTANGIENYILYSSRKSDYSLGIKYMSGLSIKKEALKSHLFGRYGFYSKNATTRLISAIDRIKPDIVHLHNMHGHNCNLELLCNYFRENKIKVFWTFHDCWNFTAYCPHYSMIKCNKWEKECINCPQYRTYSWFKDESCWLYNQKKKALLGIDMTIITPSQWLANQVNKSFLANYPIKVIKNGIDLSVFRPSNSEFRMINKIEENKFIVLGVAIQWDEKKGLDVFIELSKRLDKENYQIVLVGTNERVDRLLPSNIISIHRTQNQSELAKIYTVADVFINPTREENYPTVNMESIACGTPVITFDTGGSPEIVDDMCGLVVECDNIGLLKEEIERICLNKPYSVTGCIEKAKEFDMNNRFLDYIRLYEAQ